MHRFHESIIRPALAILHPHVIVEIGIDEGFHTQRLLTFCQKHSTTLHSIDPEPHCDIAQMQRTHGDHFVFHQDLSLNALYCIPSYDVVLIDGDHNWYTVYHELLLLEKKAKEQGQFPLVFLHDIDWPYGRRDLYYHPENIPAMYRHPYQKKGVIPGKGGLTEAQGWNPEFSNAIYEHNIRNGVLTAVEDFLAQSKEALQFTTIPGFHGLGILASLPLLSHSSVLQKFLASLCPSPPIIRHIDALENTHLDHITSDRRQRQKQYEIEQGLAREREERRGIENALREKERGLAREREERRGIENALREKERGLAHVLQSRSFRWTAPLRHAERALHTIPYRLLSAAKDAWSNLGAPFPRTARFIRHALLGRLLPVRMSAPSPSSFPSSAPQAPRAARLQSSAIPFPVAVIVVCTPAHRAIAPTIESLLAQTQKPADILVVDDSGSNDVQHAALAYAWRGIEYLHGSWRNLCAARNAGMQNTDAPLLVFLTAGSALPPDCLRACSTALSADPAAAIAYAGSSAYPFDALRLEQENIIPDATMVRREALEVVGGWPEGLYRNVEWITWRRIVANGWKVVKVPCHVLKPSLPPGGSLPAGQAGVRERGSINDSSTPSPPSSPLGRGGSPALDSTLCLSLSGRAWMWPLTSDFLERQTHPHNRTHLVIVDTSQERSFGETVQAWIARCDYGKRTYVPLAAGLKGLADLPRRVVKREVAEACASIYNTFVPYCTTPWVFFLEDDVIPPPDAYPSLLRRFGDDVVSVSALCMQRGSPHPIVWEWDSEGMPSKIHSPLEGVTAVGGNGFCCVAIRGEFLRHTQFRGGPGDFCHDHNFYKNVCERGRIALLDWSCVCRHYVAPNGWVDGMRVHSGESRAASSWWPRMNLARTSAAS